MEKSAFEQKARTWREKALNVSRHYGAGEDMAEDIAQEVMHRLWQMHDELERFRSVEAVVTLMAKHTLRDLQRRRTAESLEEATIVSLTSSPQEELEAKENEEWLIMKLFFYCTVRTTRVVRAVPPVAHGQLGLKMVQSIEQVSYLHGRGAFFEYALCCVDQC